MILLSYLNYYCIQLFSLNKTLLRVLDITKNCPYRTVFNYENQKYFFRETLPTITYTFAFDNIESFLFWSRYGCRCTVIRIKTSTNYCTR